MKATVTFALTLLFGSVIPVCAHHSFGGTYILDRTITVEGTITEFTIRNPHSYIVLDTIDSEGKVTRWGAEWGGFTLLTDTGVTKQSLKVGDKISIIGPPSRDPLEHKVLLEKIRRPSDGWNWGFKPEEVLPAHSMH